LIPGKEALEFITVENIFMKNRLSEILKDKFNTDLLEKFEHFQKPVYQTG
jgi:hypothetical protein